ncbi:MAG: hypothetical protein AB1540_04335 [Bdellovibrionota bacterium]
MEILVCAATSTEAKACGKGIVQSGLGSKFHLIETGVGLVKAKRALQSYLSSASKAPRLIVSTGFAGAVSPSIRLSSWVVAHEVFEFNDQRTLSLTTKASQNEKYASLGDPCRMVSSSELALHQLTEQLQKMTASQDIPFAVDMESSALSKVSASQGIPFLTLRFVTDTPEAPLPQFIAGFASAMAEGSLKAKLPRLLTGMVQAGVDLKGVAKLLREGPKWAEALRLGWRKHAIVLSEKIL